MIAAGYDQFLLTGCECVFNGTDAFFTVMQNKVLSHTHDTAAALERRRLASDSFYD